ncbi:transmembrane protein 256 homolog isoform X2 [Anabrus simplex]|uniref:transmembrane protein 256 homolog isoform X2 n=1 Tax=Anabrus simplex TaxID=316456 RepID=UPI0034DD15B3
MRCNSCFLVLLCTVVLTSQHAGAVMPAAKKSASNAVPKVSECTAPIWKHAYGGSSFVRLAGVFGASAVALGAYGAHNIFPKEGNEELKRVFETANRYHFLHTVALLGVPLCRWPRTAGSLLVLGMVLFSGTCYYYALTGSKQLSRFTPVGGTLLIFGWLAMVL